MTHVAGLRGHPRRESCWIDSTVMTERVNKLDRGRLIVELVREYMGCKYLLAVLGVRDRESDMTPPEMHLTTLALTTYCPCKTALE